MPGVPASETSATIRPPRMRATHLGRAPLDLRVVGLERRVDVVAREQLARHARVLGLDHVGVAQGVEDAQRDVAEVADRRGADEEAARYQTSGVSPAGGAGGAAGNVAAGCP